MAGACWCQVVQVTLVVYRHCNMYVLSVRVGTRVRIRVLNTDKVSGFLTGIWKFWVLFRYREILYYFMGCKIWTKGTFLIYLLSATHMLDGIL